MGINTGNGKRLAKNTILLYLRSLIVMLISVYSSRVLLQKLGVDDFGLYGVVGGIVAMFSSLKSVLAAAVQRFLNFEKGKGNEEEVRNIFNMSVTIHLGIAFIFGIIVEIAGCWYINHHLVIPAMNIPTALFVFHCSVVATMIAIYTIPYDAAVIANEKMDFYALQSIIDISLRLGIIFLLPVLAFEKICSYAVLILLVALFIRIMSVFYCKRFPECRKKKFWQKSLFKDLAAFAGWNFFGCIAFSLIEEGSNLILNFFGGVVANAARSLANQIRSAIMTLSNNLLVATQPFITQQAATVDIQKFWNYIFSQARMMFYVMMLTGLPIFIYVEDILSLWLTEIPPYTVEFVRAIVIYCIVMSIQKSLDLSFKAYNKMAFYQIVDACVLILTLPTVYFILSYGYPLFYTFVVFSIVRVVDYVAVITVARMQIGLKVMAFCVNVLWPIGKGTVVFIIMHVLWKYISLPSGLLMTLLGCLVLIIATLLIFYICVFTTAEKTLLKNIVTTVAIKLNSHVKGKKN